MSCEVDNEIVGVLKNSSIADNFAIDKVPYILPGKVDGINCSSHTAGTNVGVFATTKHEAECLQFLKYISRPDINRTICEAFGVIPSIKSAYDGIEVDDITRIELEIANTDSTRMPQVPYFLPSIFSASSAVQNVIFAAATGKMNSALISNELVTLQAETLSNKKMAMGK